MKKLKVENTKKRVSIGEDHPKSSFLHFSPRKFRRSFAPFRRLLVQPSAEESKVIPSSDFPMADESSFADGVGNTIIEESRRGLNPGLMVLLVIGGLVLLFLVGNYALYMYAQKTLPPRKKKLVSKKKLKRERLRQGVSAPGE